MPEKKKNYSSKYNNAWELEFSWLRKADNGPSFAFCKLCRKKMKKSDHLMIPRSVRSKKKEEIKQTSCRDQNTRPSHAIKKSRKDCPSPTRNIVRETLTDLVNQSCITEETRLKKVYMNVAPASVSEAIMLQQNAPYVDVGPVSYSKRVPVYHRNRKPVQDTSDRGHAVYTGLAWEPDVFSHRNTSRMDDRHSDRKGYYPRQWEYTEVGQQYLRHPSWHRGFEFTVMSYNVLAQNLLEDNYNMYYNSPHKVLDWKYRKKQLLKELRYHSPDVICLQEVNCDHYENFFLPELQNQGYDGVYMKRTGDKLDGCATFFKKHKFTCVQVVKVPYCHSSGGIVLDRDNVGLIVRLRPRTTSLPAHKTLTVANTHLLFNPRRGDVKLAQLMVLMAEIDKCAYLWSHPDTYQAIIMCGDFNSEPHSDIYKLIVMGYLQYEGLLVREISGQQEGKYGRGTATLDKNFFPSEIGISDTCQYCNVVRQRAQPDTNGGNSENVDIQVMETQGSGYLQHQLRLISVYEHWLSRLNYRHREVTTHHGKAACTVDYLFYGVRSGMTRFYRGEVETTEVQEGHLSLLARYGLLSNHELQDMGSLPNYAYGSDHLSLIARFLMT
ncbi:protein angel homolog 2-like isoform X2 [Mercenaria mercenaria]|uniref:protein angel homolog 2-like isoform X2 n=1 Tax=Mercenaria mercenaria TaxID=6596 RepID=UPI00234E498A|nr:protein angel homolog 2-like isoform X2 [Mercenaria mercenaria]